MGRLEPSVGWVYWALGQTGAKGRGVLEGGTMSDCTMSDWRGRSFRVGLVVSRGCGRGSGEVVKQGDPIMVDPIMVGACFSGWGRGDIPKRVIRRGNTWLVVYLFET